MHRNIISIINNAMAYNANLDTRVPFTEEKLGAANKHIDDCMKNPTRGLIARRATRRGIPQHERYFENEKTMLSFPEFSKKNQLFEDTFEKLYPKTAGVRADLIENMLVTFDNVTPKLSKFRKFILKTLHV